MTSCTRLLSTFVIAALLGSAAAAQTPATQPPPARAAAQPQSPAAAPRAARNWTDEDYKIGPGDKLRVEVYREAQLSQSLQVRPDGKITIPLAGDVQAAGRTSIELRDAVVASLREYVTNPVVTVIVQEAVASQIYVIGEVTSPGAQVLQGPLTVLQALAKAGGLKEFADRGDIRVLRKQGVNVQTLAFDYNAAVKGRVAPMFLQPGDTVVVP